MDPNKTKSASEGIAVSIFLFILKVLKLNVIQILLY